MPYETPNGCVYDSGDYARCLDIALELIGYDVARGEAPGRRVAREAARDRHRLDARLRHEQLRAVDALEPGAAVLREQRGRDGRSSTSSARSSSRSGPSRRGRDTRRRRRRSSPTSSAVTPDEVNVRAGHDTYWNSHAGFSGTYASQFAVTGLGAVKGAADKLAARDQAARGGRVRLRARTTSSSSRARRGSRATPRRRCRSWRCGAIVNANNAVLPPELRRHAQLPLRLRAAVPDARQGAQVRQPDAHVRDADPRLRRRDRPETRASTRSSTTRPWTTAATASTRRSSRARCTARPRTRSAPQRTRSSPTTRRATC